MVKRSKAEDRPVSNLSVRETPSEAELGYAPRRWSSNAAGTSLPPHQRCRLKRDSTLNSEPDQRLAAEPRFEGKRKI